LCFCNAALQLRGKRKRSGIRPLQRSNDREG
jgi:hypothetical protein